MEKFTKDIIETVANAMMESFLEDPMNIAQLGGIQNPQKLLKAHSLLHTRHAAKCGSLSILDNDPGAFMIGYDSRRENPLREKLLMGKIIYHTIWALGIKDLRIMQANMKRHGKVLSFSWYREFIQGRHFRVKIIAIDKSLRGKGAFRRLITPAIEFADREQIPMVLETHNQRNVGIYEHFGFELVKTITAIETHVQQYCMIRKPGRPATVSAPPMDK
jgi:ribosomal protein S18 acetylase RimI-like enzyme